jgi:hypothetical protein
MYQKSVRRDWHGLLAKELLSRNVASLLLLMPQASRDGERGRVFFAAFGSRAGVE